jgi:hypothetical protein
MGVVYRSTYSWPRHYFEVNGQLHAPADLPPEKEPAHWIGGWVNPRTGLDSVEKRKFLTPPGLELGMVNETIQLIKSLIYFY